MTGSYDYSATAGSNAAVGGVSVAEGMARAGVNNAMRAILADIAKLLTDLGGSKETTGAGNAYILALASVPTAYSDRLFFLATANHTNTTTATMDVNTLGAQTIKKLVAGVATALAAGDFPDGHIGLFSYSTANSGLILHNPYNTLLGIGALADPNADRIFFWDDSASASAFLAVSTGLAISGTNLSLSFLGFEALVDPNADRIAFWDDSAGAFAWLTAGTGLTITATTIAVSSSVALLDVEDQVMTGGARVTSKSLGTISTGTLTLDPGDRGLQHYTNDGAHTLAPGSNTGSIILDITNGASAGAITTSGFTKVAGSFTTTSGHKFRCHVSVGNAGSLLQIQALQ